MLLSRVRIFSSCGCLVCVDNTYNARVACDFSIIAFCGTDFCRFPNRISNGAIFELIRVGYVFFCSSSSSALCVDSVGHDFT